MLTERPQLPVSAAMHREKGLATQSAAVVLRRLAVGTAVRLPLQLRPSAPHEDALASELIKHVSDTSFENDVLKAGKPVLVDFWAEWCGPCKSFAPVLDEVAKEYQDRLTVAKLDIDSNPSTPGRYGIRGIPTVILYKDGQAAAQSVGAMSKSRLTAFLDSNL
jgi:thioredoxin 1